MKKLCTALGSLALLATIAGASAGPFDTYLSGATAVVKNAGQQAVLDQGGVLCNKTNSLPSIGGGCVLFGPWDSIRVADAGSGASVAFQVCIDNNGDGVCGGAFGQEQCFDDLFFSHTDKAPFFFNPLGRLPQGFRPGCPGGPWPGYVVLICEGVHNAGLPHAHAATSGTITGTIAARVSAISAARPLTRPPSRTSCSESTHAAGDRDDRPPNSQTHMHTR